MYKLTKRVFEPVCVNEMSFKGLDTELLVLFIEANTKNVYELENVFSYESFSVKGNVVADLGAAFKKFSGEKLPVAAYAAGNVVHCLMRETG
jgi:hypothetical protein